MHGNELFLICVSRAEIQFIPISIIYSLEEDAVRILGLFWSPSSALDFAFRLAYICIYMYGIFFFFFFVFYNAVKRNIRVSVSNCIR